MPSIRERLDAFRDGGQSARQLEAQVQQFQEMTTVLVNAYQAGPFDMPPEQLAAEIRQLAEYDPAYMGLLDDMQLYEQIGGAGAPFGDQRGLAVQRSEQIFLEPGPGNGKPPRRAHRPSARSVLDGDGLHSNAVATRTTRT